MSDAALIVTRVMGEPSALGKGSTKMKVLGWAVATGGGLLAFSLVSILADPSGWGEDVRYGAPGAFGLTAIGFRVMLLVIWVLVVAGLTSIAKYDSRTGTRNPGREKGEK